MRSELTELAYANFWRQYRDEGFRLIDFERYNTASGPRYAGIWVENDSRHDYQRKGTLDRIISAYRTNNSLPGISVAVIRNGSMIYRRGFGFATKDTKVAHGETVYSAASVSKVIGGTLAGKLEAEQRLRDGTALIRTLDLTLPTASYLRKIPVTFGFFVSIPAHHTHTVEQLLSHRGCVGHYETEPK